MAENERLSIDEVIAHCNRRVERFESFSSRENCENWSIDSQYGKEYWEHRQVADWLEELKEARKGFNENRKAGYKHGYSDGYAKAIEEFAEKLKAEILEEIYDVSERQKEYEVGSDMSITYSHIMGTLRDVRNRTIDKIAEQMKVGAI